MESSYSRKDLSRIVVATAILAMALGVSYAYVDISLNRMGESALRIGLNASMPALGWFLFTPFLPTALQHLSPQKLLLGLFAIAMIAILGLPSFPTPWAWLPLRFLFGGGIGLAFRLVEYQLNAYSPPTVRARNIGIYSAFFCGGGGLGAGLAPLLGLEGWPPVLLIFALVGLGGVVLLHLRPRPLHLETDQHDSWTALSGAGLITISGAFVFGLFEPVPYTLMPVYAVRAGIDQSMAVWTASAFLLGEVVFPVPMGLLADRTSKTRLLWLCGLCALVIPALLPITLHAPPALLGLMFLWGGTAGSLYLICLAMLGDVSRGRQLVSANAWFGTLYAAGGLIGPLYHGAAMDWAPSDGLMLSAGSLFAIFLIALGWGGKRRHAIA